MADVALRGMSPEVHEALKRAAAKNHRSLNGEILARLEASVATRTIDVDALLARIEARKARSGIPGLKEDEIGELKRVGRP